MQAIQTVAMSAKNAPKRTPLIELKLPCIFELIQTSDD